MSSFADYRSHHHTGYEQRLVDSDRFKRQRNILLCEHYKNLQIEKTHDVLFGKLQKQVENDKMQIKICCTKMAEMESSISDFQDNQQSLHYIIKQLNQKINTLDLKLTQKNHEENVQMCSNIRYALQVQQDFSLQLNHETVKKTNQLFNTLYGQIHDYIGVTDEKKIEEIKTRIKELLSSNYDYFHQ